MLIMVHFCKVLAQRLMQIQAASISRCLPDIVRKINEKLSHNVSELVSMPQNLSSVSDAIRAFMQMISSTKEMLRNIILRGEYEDTNEAMHGRARLADMLLKFSKEMPLNCPVLENEFLMDEIHVLEECKGIGLPNFLPRNAFQTLLQRKIKLVSDKPFQFVSDVWLYIEGVVLAVVLKYSDNYPQLQSSARKAVMSVIEEKKKRSVAAVKETIEKEISADYTSNPDYMNTWYELMEQQEKFMEIIQNPNREAKIKLEKFGDVEIGHLRKYSSLAEQAYDMRMRLHAYWRIVIMRMVDEFALHVLHSLKMLVEEELEAELVNEVVGSKMNGIERMLEETPMTAGKRERLKKSIELLKESSPSSS